MLITQPSSKGLKLVSCCQKPSNPLFKWHLTQTCHISVIEQWYRRVLGVGLLDQAAFNARTLESWDPQRHIGERGKCICFLCVIYISTYSDIDKPMKNVLTVCSNMLSQLLRPSLSRRLTSASWILDRHRHCSCRERSISLRGHVRSKRERDCKTRLRFSIE